MNEEIWGAQYLWMTRDHQVLERDGKLGELDERADILQVNMSSVYMYNFDSIALSVQKKNIHNMMKKNYF